MTDVRERLARFLAAKAIAASDNGERLPDNLWAQKLPLADAILAAFPELTPPSGSEAVEAARSILARPRQYIMPEERIAATYILSLAAPAQDAVEAAREAKTEARVREECAKKCDAVQAAAIRRAQRSSPSEHYSSHQEAVAAGARECAAAIRAEDVRRQKP